MSNIPTIPGTSRIADQSIGVKIDSRPAIEALGQAGRTFAAGAQAASDVVGAIADYEVKKQKAEEVAAVNQASITMRKVTNTYRDSLRHNPNDQQWVNNWQQTASHARDSILSDPRFKGAARTHMVQQLDTWQGDTTSEFQTAADVAGSGRRKRIGLLAADEALKDGNETAATAAVDGLVKTGDMWKEEATSLKGTFLQTIEVNQVLTGMANNPKAVYEQLRQTNEKGSFVNFPSIKDVKERQRLISESNSRMNALQSQHLQDLVDQTSDSLATTPSDNELEGKVKAGEITAKGANSIRALIAKKNLSTAKDTSTVLAMQVHDHDFTVDDKPEQTAREFRDELAALPLALQKPIAEQITNKLNAAKKNALHEERPVEKEVFDRMKEDRELNGLTIPMSAEITKDSSGFLGMGGHPESIQYKHVSGGLKALRTMTDDQLQKLFGEGATQSKVIAAEELHYAQQTSKMRAWFKANPTATDDEAEAYRVSLERPYVMSSVSAELLKHHPTTVTGEEDFNALPAGAPFMFNGRMGVKK